MSSNDSYGATPATSSLTEATPRGQWTSPPADNDEPSSTADVAKDQAASVADNAKDAAKDVAGTAKDQAGQVVGEAKKQVKDLVGQARTELTDQAQVQQQRVAGGLHSVGEQLRAMAEGATEQGPVTDLTHQAADKAHEIADFFDNRDPGSVLSEVRAFARKQPGVFLALSLGAGVLAGRLARGLSADSEDSAKATSGTPGSALGGSPYPSLPAGGVGTPAATPGLPSGEAGFGGELTTGLGSGR